MKYIKKRIKKYKKWIAIWLLIICWDCCELYILKNITDLGPFKLNLKEILIIECFFFFLLISVIYYYRESLFNRWVSGHLKLWKIESLIVIAFLPLQGVILRYQAELYGLHYLYTTLPMLIWIIEPFNGNNFPTYHSKTTKILVYLKIAIVFVTLLTLVFIGMLKYL